jgi:hypothetical protein
MSNKVLITILILLLGIGVVATITRGHIERNLTPAGQMALEQEAKKKADNSIYWNENEFAVGFASGVRRLAKDKSSFEVEDVFTKRNEKTGTVYICMKWSAKNSFGGRNARRHSTVNAGSFLQLFVY